MIVNMLKQISNTLSSKKTLLLCGFVLFIVLFAESSFADDFSENCSSDKLNEKYGGDSCWCCDIIHTLLSSFLGYIQYLYNDLLDLSEVILQVGGSIWIAVYLLKTLGSLGAQDSGKILDGLFIFMFKWSLVYILIVSGLDELVGKVVSPILSIGFDIGNTFTKGV